jgi:2-dehydro-3-deoxyphosphogluconate aldolase/(4S)-4-hydroxy-2-oxoglutarate aldolase
MSVVEIKDADTAPGLAAALVAGGLPILEITLRTEAALPALAKVAAAHKGVTLAAGTVVTTEQVKKAVDAGAQLIVSPGLSNAVVEYCLKHSVPVLPGVCTPSEVEMARGYGLKYVKFFPAEAFGGVRTLWALNSVYGGFGFVPTGGVNMRNLGDYLKIPTVIACGGTWLAPTEKIVLRQFDAITESTREAVAAAHAVV